MNNPEHPARHREADESKDAPTYKEQKNRRGAFMEDLTAGIDANLNKLRKSAGELGKQGEP
jgi:hypothetical protein